VPSWPGQTPSKEAAFAAGPLGSAAGDAFGELAGEPVAAGAGVDEFGAVLGFGVSVGSQADNAIAETENSIVKTDLLILIYLFLVVSRIFPGLRQQRKAAAFRTDTA